jgi:hypothetical protein
MLIIPIVFAQNNFFSIAQQNNAYHVTTPAFHAKIIRLALNVILLQKQRKDS